jgi:hypothetical protein
MKGDTEYTELSSVKVSVPQATVLGTLLHLVYTADMPTSTESTTATFADDTAVLATDIDPDFTSQKLETNLDTIYKWFKKWKTKGNGSKSHSPHREKPAPSPYKQLTPYSTSGTALRQEGYLV